MAELSHLTNSPDLVRDNRFELLTSNESNWRSTNWANHAWSRQEESNLHLNLRSVLFYPLNYNGNIWWRWQDSNPLPWPCKGPALPDELHPQMWWYWNIGAGSENRTRKFTLARWQVTFTSYPHVCIYLLTTVCSFFLFVRCDFQKLLDCKDRVQISVPDSWIESLCDTVYVRFHGFYMGTLNRHFVLCILHICHVLYP